jgi:hypothetical protein
MWNANRKLIILAIEVCYRIKGQDDRSSEYIARAGELRTTMGKNSYRPGITVPAVPPNDSGFASDQAPIWGFTLAEPIIARSGGRQAEKAFFVYWPAPMARTTCRALAPCERLPTISAPEMVDCGD